MGVDASDIENISANIVRETVRCNEYLDKYLVKFIIKILMDPTAPWAYCKGNRGGVRKFRTSIPLCSI